MHIDELKNVLHFLIENVLEKRSEFDSNNLISKGALKLNEKR